VSVAADIATDGEVYASPAAMLQLALCCDVPEHMCFVEKPILIALRGETYVDLGPDVHQSTDPDGNTIPAALQPYESLRLHCASLSPAALARLHLQMALYVHPVIRGDELALSAAIQAGKIAQPTEAVETRHRAEAELRSVFTIFIKAIITPRVTGMDEIDSELFQKLWYVFVDDLRNLNQAEPDGLTHDT
jgi:hypothetical protein